MSEQMDFETTYQCPTCHCNILSANQFTHDAICARRQATENQRPAQPQIIRRESSSSGLPDAVDSTASRRKPQVREDRVLTNNKLVTCPDCEKSVREQHLQSHINSECQGNDKIPCEFCDQVVPMSVYTQHVEDRHRREREQEQQQHEERQEQLRQDQQRQQEIQRQEEQQQRQRQRSNERPVSPGRGLSSRQNQEERSQPSGRSQERDRSPGRGHEENSGGFMGFLRNLVHSATQNRAEPIERPQPVEQPQHQSIFSRLAGLGDHQEQQQRSRPLSMEDFFLRAMQGGENSQRRNVQSQNPFMPQQQANRGRAVRTIRFGPHGTLVISSGGNAMQQEEEPEDYWQTVGVPQQRAQQREVNMGPLSEMGPMGLILQMLASRNQGLDNPFLNPEQMHQLEEKGLSKDDVESLSVVKYDKEKNKNLSEDLKSCPICLDEFEDGVEVKFLWCLHRFHKKCIDQWLDKHTNCPICKKDFSEIDQGFSG